MLLIKLLYNFINIFYPRCCPGCEKALPNNENILCVKCAYYLPMTNFHLRKENKMKNIFWDLPNVDIAIAFVYFSYLGATRKIIHNLKYHNVEKLGSYLGEWYGEILKNECKYIKKIDMIIPVPLHPKKERKRGYNQVHLFSKELANKIGVEYNNTILYRLHHRKSQTKTANWMERYENTKDLYAVHKDKIHLIKNKNILIVDDVMTTGATLKSCYSAINNETEVNISFLTIAKAGR